MKPGDFPALQQAANRASQKHQRIYLFLFRFSLLLVVAGAGLSTISSAVPCIRPTGLVIGAALLAISLVLTLAIKIRTPERVWYAGRAIAESVKTITWRFAMCAKPFSVSLTMPDAESLFIKELQSILAEKKHLAWSLGGTPKEQPQITDWMRRAREMDLQARMNLYRDERVVEQRDWYSNKAASNQHSHEIWFWGTLLIQLGALLWAMVMIRNGKLVNATSIFSSIATAMLAWSQVKRYQELSQAYSLTAHELGMIVERLRHIQTEDQFSLFVGDSESAISREHTFWIARRDTI